MDLTRVVLESGRSIVLATIEISATYSRFLDGYPCARVNDTMILVPMREAQGRFRGVPRHVIEPERSYPDEPAGPLGPVELLPAVTCTALFRSRPVDPALAVSTHDSWLSVTWFQHDISAPVAQFVAAAVAGLDWESLAGDTET